MKIYGHDKLVTSKFDQSTCPNLICTIGVVGDKQILGTFDGPADMLCLLWEGPQQL